MQIRLGRLGAALISAAALAIGMVSTGIASGTARLHARTPARSPSFWFTSTGSQSLAQAVDRDVSAYPAHYGPARATLEAMLANLNAGLSVGYVPGASTPQQQRQQVEVAIEDLPAGRGSSSGARMTSAATSQAIGNPNSFPKRGNAINARLSWQMPFELDARHCENGECVVPEKLKASLMVDPGALTSVVNARLTTIHLQPGSYFDNVHFQWWVLCYRNQEVCGGPQNESFGNSTSITWRTGSNVLLRGDKVTHAFIFWARLIPANRYYGDKAKTGTATCLKRSNKCRY